MAGLSKVRKRLPMQPMWQMNCTDHLCSARRRAVVVLWHPTFRRAGLGVQRLDGLGLALVLDSRVSCSSSGAKSAREEPRPIWLSSRPKMAGM